MIKNMYKIIGNLSIENIKRIYFVLAYNHAKIAKHCTKLELIYDIFINVFHLRLIKENQIFTFISKNFCLSCDFNDLTVRVLLKNNIAWAELLRSLRIGRNFRNSYYILN